MSEASKTVDISGLTRPMVLAALYNSSKAFNMGLLQYDPTPMTVGEATQLLEEGRSFDYLKGRLMKISIPGDDEADEIDPRLYDRDLGEGAAAAVIDELYRTSDVNSAATDAMHKEHQAEALEKTEEEMKVPSEWGKTEGNMATLHLGMGDMAGPLGEAIDKIRSASPEDDATGEN